MTFEFRIGDPFRDTRLFKVLKYSRAASTILNTYHFFEDRTGQVFVFFFDDNSAANFRFNKCYLFNFTNPPVPIPDNCGLSCSVELPILTGEGALIADHYDASTETWVNIMPPMKDGPTKRFVPVT